MSAADDNPAPRSGRASAGDVPDLAPGLHFVATPIGAARDITLRALDVLRAADLIAAEDTRSTRRLMEIHGVPLGGRPLVAYHDHNGAQARPRLLRALADGLRVAYASEAGTPLVADPGYQLARAAIEAGHAVSTAPGPSAAIAALTVAGLPSDRFLFAGFAPAQAGARAQWLAELAEIRATLVLFESPKRVHRLLGELCESLGGDRQAALCRELTKRFEEVRRGTLAALMESVEADSPRGEIVLVIDRGAPRKATEDDVREQLKVAMRTQKVKDAARDVANACGLPRRDVYQIALSMKDAGELE